MKSTGGMFFSLLKETWSEFQKDEIEQRGAALAYYSMFSVFPLLILLLAIIGFFLRHWDEAINVREELLQSITLRFSPQLSDTLGQILEALRDNAGAATGIGGVALFLGAARVLQQLNSTFHKIWKVPAEPQPFSLLKTVSLFLKDKFSSILMVLAVGLLFLLSFALTGVTQALLKWFSQLPVVGGVAGFLVGVSVSIIFNALLFSLIFKYLPPVKVLWSDVKWGALLTAIIWEAAKILLSIYLKHTNYVSAYETVGAALVLMAWVYFSSQFLFFGAEFTKVYARRCGSRKGDKVMVREP